MKTFIISARVEVSVEEDTQSAAEDIAFRLLNTRSAKAVVLEVDIRDGHVSDGTEREV